MRRMAGAEEIRPILDDLRRRAADYCGCWDALMETLDEFEQLFIAV